MHTPPRLLPVLALFAALLVAACAAPAPRPTVEESALDRVERLLASQQYDAAEQALAQVHPDRLNPRDAIRLRLVRAELSLVDGQPYYTLQDLPPPRVTADRQLAARVEALRARALLRMGDPAGAVVALVARSELLSGTARNDNDERIWQTLMGMSLGGSAQQTFAAADRVARGWYELALIARGLLPGAREPLLADWRQRYRDHPASAQRALWAGAGSPVAGYSLDGVGAEGEIAVLLPFTGAFGDISRAVRDGLLAAWYAAPQPRPRLRFYDTGSSDEGLMFAWQTALEAGAGFVIGPMRRDAVAALAALGELPVPVLALNYLDPGQLAPQQLYQFGLAPEDEARAAAARMLAERQSRAVAMIPDSEWGQRVLTAFREQFEAGGGMLLESQHLASGADHSRPIRALLNLDDSESRHRAVRTVVGNPLEFQPRRRSDAQAIFLAARPEEAMAVRPQFRFHRAADLPMYAVSLVWDGHRDIGPELRGLRVCDMPWMMSGDDGEWRPARDRLAAASERGFARHPRLFALGHDAYRLAGVLQQGWPTGLPVAAASGELILAADHSIHRELGCATLVRDGAEPLPPPTEASLGFEYFDDGGLDEATEPDFDPALP